MHKKRIYKALAIVISVSMILPFSSYVGAESEGNTTEIVVEETTDETVEVTPEVTPEPEETPEEDAEVTPVPGEDTEVTPTPGEDTEVTPTPGEDAEVTPTPGEDAEVTPTPGEDAEVTPAPEEDTEVIVTPEVTVEPTVTPEVTEEPTATPEPTVTPEVTEEPTVTPEVTPSPYSTNEELIASQQIIIPPVIAESFRFTTVDKVYAVCNVEELNIYEEKSEDSVVVGKMEQDGLCFVLKEEADSDWIFVESGVVRGFVEKEDLLTGDKAKEFVEKEKEENLLLAESLVDPLENKALTYTKTTVRETVVEKEYALAIGENINVREDTSEEARIIGVLPKDGLCFVLAENIDDWTYVESDDVRGFVKTELLLIGDEAEAKVAEAGGWTEEQETEFQKVITAYQDASKALDENDLDPDQTDEKTEELNKAYTEAKEAKEEALKQKKEILEKGEESYQFAEEKIEPVDNAACYYTLTSVKDASVSSIIGTSMVEFAKQFLGNPYVWGGTSLTNGADCSGFVQQIYAQYGYSLPRTSREQSQYGLQIPIEEAQPGDLIFYANNGTVYHVVMYMGNGQVIHASSSRTGIITSGIDYTHAVWATRVISDEDSDKLEAVKAKAANSFTSYTLATTNDYGELLGSFKLTAYCNCSICCGKWAGGPTASGTVPTQGRTVAMGGVPFGTKLIINGKIYTVEDRGTPYGHVDIYMNDHDECNQFGVQSAQVYLVK